MPPRRSRPRRKVRACADLCQQQIETASNVFISAAQEAAAAAAKKAEEEKAAAMKRIEEQKARAQVC